MHTAYLLLGSNLGNRLQYLESAISQIEAKVGKMLQKSSVYETEAWGATEDLPPHLNQAIYIETSLESASLLSALQAIENDLERSRIRKWGSRTIDIDIIFYDEDIIETAALSIPHPYLEKRMFALKPLAEIAKDHLHPISKKTLQQLLEECNDSLAVNIFE
jgi:2-amino-4-hydroxy-6-hydroxymethyldihydropteridine diphosphokinase